MRGRTTQKRVSSTTRLSVPLASSAVAMTPETSGARVSLVIVPTSMSLYLILVLPACRPSAVRKLMMIVVPRSSQYENASQAPTAMAIAGTTQMSGSERRELRADTACGIESGGGVLLTLAFHRIPEEARIEVARRRHGEHYHRAESERARPGLDVAERAQLHDRGQEGNDEDVEHRPAADGLERAVEAGPLEHASFPAELHGEEQDHEAEHLGERHGNARHEHDDREVPGAVVPQEDDPAHDRVGLRAVERARR